MNSVEQMRGQALFLQRLKDTDDLTLGADHANVAGPRLHGPTQDPHVVAVAARDNHDIGRFVRIELLHRIIELKRMNLAGRTEPFFGDVGTTVSGANYAEPPRTCGSP